MSEEQDLAHSRRDFLRAAKRLRSTANNWGSSYEKRSWIWIQGIKELARKYKIRIPVDFPTSGYVENRKWTNVLKDIEKRSTN